MKGTKLETTETFNKNKKLLLSEKKTINKLQKQ